MHRGTILTSTVSHHSFIRKYHLVAIDTEEEVEESYLPNVLKRMDELLSQGLSCQNGKQGILDWTLDAFFRGLIIASCRDCTYRNVGGSVPYPYVHRH